MSEQRILPVSAIIPTKDRVSALIRTLTSLAQQSCLPSEIIIVDASSSNESEIAIQQIDFPHGVSMIYARARIKGAAQQRVQAIDLATTAFVFFMDDDIIFEDHCVERVFSGFSQGTMIGAVNAMITNQHYTPPGLPTRSMYIMLSGKKKTWAGKVIGPAWNLLPEDNEELPAYVECEWLNTTCTMYRREALPQPVFPDRFYGYSIMEDLTLSLRVAKNWTLLNARTARIFHDSQPGVHKDNVVAVSEMEVVNRHYVMTQVLARTAVKNYAQLFLFEMFMIFAMLASRSQRRLLPKVILGKIKGYVKIIFS